MKFNREQITKAAEILEGAKVMVLNRDFDDFQNAIITALNTFELIKELIDENEYLKQQNEIYAILNKKLEDACESYAWQYGTAISKELFLKKECADTVRKMQEKLREYFSYNNITLYREFTIREIVDDIAKEMLED